jgi:ammonium transporter, Amt family
VFASKVVNAAGEAGGLTQLGRQLVLAVVAIIYPFAATWIILWATDRFVGLKVSPDDEESGLDFAEHGESSYGWSASPVPATANGDSASAAPAGAASTAD